MSDQLTDMLAITPNGSIEELEGQILELIGDSQPLPGDERRVRERYPICCRMLLTPVDPAARELLSETAMIFGKDLSRSGICFSHELPLTHKRMVITLTQSEVGQFRVEAEVAWTRQTLVGLYETGCRLIRKVM
jgi:hypothetical protein